MNDLKKLFKRDRFYWGIMMVVMTLVAIYMMSNVYDLEQSHKLFHLEDYLESSQYLHGLWDTHPELRGSDSTYLDDIISYMFLERMVFVTVIVAFIAQAVRLLVQETRNRTEVLRTFPVKSRNLLTCHYLSGLLMVGIPLLIQTTIVRLDIFYVEKNTDFIFSNKEQLWTYAGKAVIIFMLYYSLLIFCKNVTNHVPGTIFTFVVVKLALEVLVGHYLGLYCTSLADYRASNWVFWSIVALVLIILSYIADQKKDCARNGFYAFDIVHWVMMVIVFVEIYFIFYGVDGDISKAVSILVAIAASMLITSGVHFVTKPKI